MRVLIVAFAVVIVQASIPNCTCIQKPICQQGFAPTQTGNCGNHGQYPYYCCTPTTNATTTLPYPTLPYPTTNVESKLRRKPSVENYGSCDSASGERLNEGYCQHRYRDSKGIWTIGIGFNLQQSSAKSSFAACGGDYNAIMQGADSCHDSTSGQTLSDSVIQCLFEHSIMSARNCPASLVSNFASLQGGPQSALVDMAYNMGCAGLGAFHNTLKAVEAKDFSAAAVGMQNSLWCGQVGSRCDRDIACMKSGDGEILNPGVKGIRYQS